MSKDPLSHHDKALAFILDNFTDDDGGFDCPYGDEAIGYAVPYCWKISTIADCDNCQVQRDFNEIMGISPESE